MFTASEREDFAVHGLIKRKDFLPIEKLTSARKVIYQHLEQEGVWRDGNWHLDGHKYSSVHAASVRLVKPLWRHKTMIDLINDDSTLAAVTALLNERPVLPKDEYPAILFTLPNGTNWTVPHGGWHLDMQRLSTPGVSGVQIFALLETVDPGGGGTLVVTGSHCLLDDGVHMKSKDVREKFKEEPYFAELMSKESKDRQHFMDEIGYVGDVGLKVVEMTGKAGDVYFMDMRMLHTGVPNALQVPRIMLTYRYLLESSHVALFGSET